MLLHMISQIDRATPVLFLDTGKHFRATLDYRHQLVGRLGLADVRDILPVADSLAKEDPFGALSMTDKDRCCFIRKVEPMARAVAPYRAWMTGRKQFQASTRNGLPVFESVGPRIRINRWRAGGPKTSGLCRKVQPAAAPADRAGLSLHRLHALHTPRLGGRGSACRTLGGVGKDRMRHSSFRPCR
ncbi:phosphoadenosine phosphosulfate reductase [Brucella ceti TE28753-12]|nr:phosphoadenosine phosphosulfate reductase family protein [Brucella ceti]AHB02619.1 phosphoadenosine phosphosulfate reductase [Brucella ceti TE28753-12]